MRWMWLLLLTTVCAAQCPVGLQAHYDALESQIEATADPIILQNLLAQQQPLSAMLDACYGPSLMAGWTPPPLPKANPGICLNSRWNRFWGGQRWRLCRKGEHK